MKRIKEIYYRISDYEQWERIPVKMGTISDEVKQKNNDTVRERCIEFSLKLGEDFDFDNLGEIKIKYIDGSWAFVGNRDLPANIVVSKVYSVHVKVIHKMSFSLGLF